MDGLIDGLIVGGGGVNVAPPTYWDKVDGLIYGCL